MSSVQCTLRGGSRTKSHAWDRLPGQIQEAAMQQCLEDLEKSWEELEKERQGYEESVFAARDSYKEDKSMDFSDFREKKFEHMPSMAGVGKFASLQEKWYAQHKLYSAVCSANLHDVRRALDHACKLGIDEKTNSLLRVFCDVLARQQEHSGFRTSEVARALEKGDWMRAFDLLVEISLSRGADRSLLLTALSRLCADSNCSKFLKKTSLPISSVPQTRERTSIQQEEFYVTLKRLAQESFGLALEIEDSVIRISSVHDQGAAKRHNDTFEPGRRIRVGFHIVEVNGVSRDANRMSEILETERTVKLLLRKLPADGYGDVTNAADLSNMRSQAMQFVISPGDAEDVRGRLIALLHAEASEHAQKAVSKAWQDLDDSYRADELQGGSKGFGPGYTPLSWHEEEFFIYSQINNAVHQESLPELRRAIGQATASGIPATSLEIEIAYRDALMRHQQGGGFSQAQVLTALEAGNWWDALDDVFCACFVRGADRKLLVESIAKVATRRESPAPRQQPSRKPSVRTSRTKSPERQQMAPKRGLLTKENVESMTMSEI